MWYPAFSKLGARAEGNYDKWLVHQGCSESAFEEPNVLIVEDMKIVGAVLMHDPQKFSHTQMWTRCLLEWTGGLR